MNNWISFICQIRKTANKQIFECNLAYGNSLLICKQIQCIRQPFTHPEEYVCVCVCVAENLIQLGVERDKFCIRFTNSTYWKWINELCDDGSWHFQILLRLHATEHVANLCFHFGIFKQNRNVEMWVNFLQFHHLCIFVNRKLSDDDIAWWFRSLLVHIILHSLCLRDSESPYMLYVSIFVSMIFPFCVYI